MDFEKTKEFIKGSLGVPVVLDGWTCTPLYVVEEREYVLRVNFSFSFEKDTVDRELKFVAEHFSSPDKYEEEIHRILNRYDAFTDALDKISEIVKYNEGKPLSDEGSWKGTTIGLERISPFRATATFIFSKVDDHGVLLSFTKPFDLYQDSFVSYETYLEELDTILANLNTINSIPTGYYESTITRLSY